MGYDSSGPFITSLVEMKLDRTTMFEWQRHTQEISVVPHYAEILEYIDLRARASETVFCEGLKHHSQPNKSDTPTKTTYVANIDTACMSYGVGKHPLYACRKFKSLSPEQCMEQVRKHQLCFNCLQPGHFAPKCASDQKFQKCQKSHHMLLHPQFECDATTKTTGHETKTQSLSTEPNGSSESQLAFTCI